MLTAERLHEILAAIPGVEQVFVDEHEDDRRLVARVIAYRFERLDEAQRQAEIYGVLLDELKPHELRRVEFVFTDTPREYADLVATRDGAASP